MFAIYPLPDAASELFAQVSQTGKLTLADRYGLLAILLDEASSEEERQMLDRLLYALRKGRVQVINELSSLNDG
jgi:hypothetical protein